MPGSNIRTLSLISMIAAVPLFGACSQTEDETTALSPEAEERHELMEGVGKAAKPLGGMMKGEVEFDADKVMESLTVWADAAAKLGSLVPAGSEGGEAAPAIWEDPEGFADAITVWADATAAAIEAAPTTLDEAKPVIGPAFNACKNCHDDFRIEKD